jgi:tRNA (guanine10-N2)-dimethyltransferase
MPVRKVDCIVTDPPYGRSAKTLGREVSEIVADFLRVAADCIAQGRRVCIAFPKGVVIGKLAGSSGFKVVESHYVYVHRSLTREVAVLERA